MDITVRLGEESAAVLLRCLAYGESAVSVEEINNGVGLRIKTNVESIRRQIVNQMSESIILEARKDL